MLEAINPQELFNKLKKEKRISIKPIYDPIINELREKGIVYIDLNDSESLDKVKDVINKGIGKVALILSDLPLDDLHFRMRECTLEDDIDKVEDYLSKIEKLLNELPDFLRNYLQAYLKDIQDFVEKRKNKSQ